MANDECNKLLVCWEQHRRFIYVDNNDNLDTIKQSIIKVYSLQQSIDFINYQIQYYDEIYQTFIDLSDNTLDDFRELLQKLQTSDISTRNEKIWCLNVIPNKMARINLTSSDPVTVDINNYPPKKNSDKSIEQSTSETNNQIDDSTSSLDSMINITDLYGVSTSSQVESGKRHKLSNESDFVISQSLKFRFEIDIADHQRRQYESDMVRKGSSNSILGGVLLRGSNTNDPTLHPLVYFEIPKSQWNSRWSLRLYVLTECDSSGTFYRHASKGIYDNVNKLHDRFAPIENSNLVNPDVIYLSSDQIQQGQYESDQNDII
ncbi:hypothetical protein I4U23_013929 [Adineta vaga]|nr:hypothetical protein I4U23_013929 [Adineta vaga]